MLKLIGRGLEVTKELFGVAAAFQSVFGADIDRSDLGLEAAFKEVDTDYSGKISAEEMRSYISKLYGKALDEKVLTDMMAAADTDHDGEVDLDEFKAIMRSGPSKRGEAAVSTLSDAELMESRKKSWQAAFESISPAEYERSWSKLSAAAKRQWLEADLAAEQTVTGMNAHLVASATKESYP